MNLVNTFPAGIKEFFALGTIKSRTNATRKIHLDILPQRVKFSKNLRFLEPEGHGEVPKKLHGSTLSFLSFVKPHG